MNLAWSPPRSLKPIKQSTSKGNDTPYHRHLQVSKSSNEHARHLTPANGVLGPYFGLLGNFMQRCCFPWLGVRPGSISLGFMVQSSASEDHRISKMAQQVKDVLPHVPLNVIAKDLGMEQIQCPWEVVYWTIKLIMVLSFCVFELKNWTVVSHIQRKPIVLTPP